MGFDIVAGVHKKLAIASLYTAPRTPFLTPPLSGPQGYPPPPPPHFLRASYPPLSLSLSFNRSHSLSNHSPPQSLLCRDSPPPATGATIMIIGNCRVWSDPSPFHVCTYARNLRKPATDHHHLTFRLL